MKTMSMNAPAWYRGWIRGKTRIALAWIFAAVLVFSARQYPNLPGILVCFFGATLRFWASGFLRKDRYPAVGGPYGMTRNPLYLGTFLMALGTVIAIQNGWLFAIVAASFTAIYHYIILDEETKLRDIFETPYLAYCEAVPRFFPRPWPLSKDKRQEINPNESHYSFSWELAMKNRAYEAYASFLGLIGFVWAVAWAWKTFA